MVGDRIRRVLAFVALTAVAASCRDATILVGPNEVNPTFAVVKGSILVNSLADPGDGACTSSECTLREAIAAAEPGDRVTFRSNLSGTIALAAGEIVIDKSIAIDGPGPGRLIVDAQGASRVVRVDAGATVSISGLSITGGALPAGIEGGGGILNRGTLTIIGSTVAGNRAASPADGGGVLNEGALTVLRSTVSGNSAHDGGGIASVGAGSVTLIVLSTVSENEAHDDGGGIYNPAGGALTLRSSTVTRNDGELTGGVFTFSGTTTLVNSIVAGNTELGSPSAPNADCSVTSTSGTLISLGHNLTGSGTGCPSDGAGDVLVHPSLIFTDVIASVLAGNGGSTFTHAPIERGYAVDAGYCPGETGDQRGLARPYDDTRMPNALDACDIGAVEWQPVAARPKK